MPDPIKEFGDNVRAGIKAAIETYADGLDEVAIMVHSTNVGPELDRAKGELLDANCPTTAALLSEADRSLNVIASLLRRVAATV